jgi:hypothetical protein
MLAENRFAIHLSKIPLTLKISAMSLANSTLGICQRAFYGSRISKTEIRHHPLFIIGHWRSGTTWLHELLACDEQFATPLSYDCFAPHHFLLTRRWLPHLLQLETNVKRPMDQMKSGWDHPQEDEFALALLGLGSPYTKIAFPNHPAPDIDLAGWKAQQWQQGVIRFFKALTMLGKGRRLLLKSPTHSYRALTLHRMFQEARFVHIVRNPYLVYASTLNLWRTMFGYFSLQKPSWESLQQEILDNYIKLHESVEAARERLPGRQFQVLRYEDLVQDPLSQLRDIYRSLELNGFEESQANFTRYLTAHRDHVTNRYLLTDEERLLIQNRWGAIIDRYGYEPP